MTSERKASSSRHEAEAQDGGQHDGRVAVDDDVHVGEGSGAAADEDRGRGAAEARRDQVDAQIVHRLAAAAALVASSPVASCSRAEVLPRGHLEVGDRETAVGSHGLLEALRCPARRAGR